MCPVSSPWLAAAESKFPTDPAILERLSAKRSVNHRPPPAGIKPSLLQDHIRVNLWRITVCPAAKVKRS